MAGQNGGYIDADGHVRDSDRNYRAYLEEPYKSRTGNLFARGENFDRRMNGTLGTEHVDAEVWLSQLDAAELDATVLYPSGGLGLGFVRERGLAVALCRAYNDFMHSEYLKVSPRLKAVALVPVQDPDEAASELRRAVTELGMVGGMLAAHGPYLLGKPEFDPLFQEAERLGTMLAVHASGSNPFGTYEWQVDSFIQAHMFAHSFAQMQQLTSVVFEGVPEKFPRLRLAFLEAGCTWVPYWMDRMDEHYELRGQAEAPILTRKPSDYIRGGQIYFSCEAEEHLIPQVLETVNEDVVVFASDFPHWDSSFPHNLHELKERGDLTDRQKAKVLGENARALYGLNT
jgi:uncharacterized protein